MLKGADIGGILTAEIELIVSETKKEKRSHNIYVPLLVVGVLFLNAYTGFTQVQEWEKSPTFGTWLRVEYKNFVFIYEPHSKSFVDRLVRLTDTFYEQYGGIFNHYPKKVPVVVQGRTSLGNGQVDLQPPTVIVNVATLDSIGAKDDDWASFLFKHEYAHFVHLTYGGGINMLSKIFGSGALAIVGGASPPWYKEGLAVNFESDMTNMGRLYHPNMIVPTRADILLGKENGYLVSTLVITDEHEGGRQYQYGMFFIDYLKRQYGYKAVIEMWKEFANFPIDMSSRAKKVLGKSLYDLHAEMQADLRERFTSETGDFPRGSQFYKQRYDNTQIGIIGNTDKGLLLYKNTPNAKTTFTFLNLINKKETNVLSVNTISGIAAPSGGGDVTPDGRYIAYVAHVVDPSTTPTINFGARALAGNFVDVFMYDTVSKRNLRLTKGQALQNPAISPDGSFVVVSQNQRLIKISVDTSRKEYEMLYAPGASLFPSKVISPDGKHLVFVEYSTLNGNSLKVMNLATKKVTTLLQRDNALYFSNPRFINNNEITVASDIEMPTKVMMLYKVNIQENTWVRIARDKVGVQEGILTETGDVLYISNSGTGNEVYQYSSSNKDDVPIDLDTLPVFQFDEDRLDTYTGDGSIGASASGDASNSTATVSNPKRVWSFIPSRFNVWYPTGSLSFFNGGGFLNIGAGASWKSSNRLSNLSVTLMTQLAFGKLASSFQPLYNIRYGYSWFPLGDIRLNFTRTHAYDRNEKQYKLEYTNILKYGRLLYAGVFGTTVGISLGTSITSAEYAKNIIQVGDSFKNLVAGDYTVKNEYGVVFTFAGAEAKGYSSRVRKGFGWKIGIGSNYRPTLFNVSKHQVLGILDASICIPIARYPSITLSAYNTVSNVSNYGMGIDYTKGQRAERFERVTPITFMRSKSAVGGGKGSIETPIRSSMAIDVLIPFGFFRNVGSYLISPYSAYINLFAEQTVGTTYKGTFKYNEHVVLGQEVGVDIAILYLPIKLSVGSAFKVPYGKSSQFDYQVYFMFDSVAK